MLTSLLRLPTKSVLLTTLLLIVGTACEEYDCSEELLARDIDLKLYRPNQPGRHRLTGTLIQDDFQASFFNHIAADFSVGSATALYLGDVQDEQETAILLDEVGQPAFLYSINRLTGEKENTLIEFDPITRDSIYLRVFEYRWEERLSTLLAETLITGNQATGFQFHPQYVLKDPVIIVDSVARTYSKGQTIGTPHARLERISRGSVTFSSQRQQYGGLAEGVDGFRDDYRNAVQNDVAATINEVSDIILRVGAAGAAASLFGANAPLAVASAAMLAVGGAGKFIPNVALHERVIDFLSGVRDNIAEVPDTFAKVGENIVEYFDTYDLNITDHWITATEDEHDDNLQEILEGLEEAKLLLENEELDDLPDSRGVLHISLNWQIPGDIDLHVFDPTGAHIFYDNRTSSIGYLDRDDQEGTGPENIYFTNPPDGRYTIQVVHYEGPAPNPFRVGCTDGLGFQLTRSGSVGLNSSVTVANVAIVNGRAELL